MHISMHVDILSFYIIFAPQNIKSHQKMKIIVFGIQRTFIRFRRTKLYIKEIAKFDATKKNHSSRPNHIYHTYNLQ